ncbi:DUF4388 domain-containing protein [Krasilnikovia sp. MM14-A1259]|uniref:DUF4388 domain-containing protein n=1 Tax=Krasilnikovia sp. MM14-A1259 TaxID=3373539 RepID=UPI0037F71E25
MAAETAAPGRLLRQAAAERRTGALVVTGRPGGTLYLTDGLVTYAESPAAPGVGELLTASGRLAARTWQAALDVGTARSQVGRLLLDQGHLTRGELELCVHGATYDAAYFALGPAAAGADFVAGETHWLGAMVWIDPEAVDHESRRRQRLLDEIFPFPHLDSAPVSPVARPPAERIWLTAPQWELIVHADGQRTPADLAQLLGRAGFATIQELRRLGALGLLELPEPRTHPPDVVRPSRAAGAAVDITTRTHVAVADGNPTVRILAPQHPAVTVQAAVPAPAQTAVTAQAAVPASAHAAVPAPAEQPPGMDGAGLPPPRLARREPGARLPAEFVDIGAAEPPATDEVLLKRIRTALRSLR